MKIEFDDAWAFLAVIIGILAIFLGVFVFMLIVIALCGGV